MLRHVVGTTRSEHEDHNRGGVEDPQVPTETDLALDRGEHQPTCLIAVPQRLPSALVRQGLVDRLEQRQQPLEGVGYGAQRQIQVVRLEVRQEPVGRTVDRYLSISNSTRIETPRILLGMTRGAGGR